MTNEQADLLFKLKYGEKEMISKVTEENYQSYLKALGQAFYYNWDRLANIYTLNYDPIENYNRTETESVSTKNTNTPDITEDFTENNRKEVYETDIYGYNSTEPTSSDKNTNTYTGGNTRKRTGTEKDEGETSRTMNAKGNIGVTTTQQMATQETEYWNNMNILLNYIFEDIKNVLTIPIY